MNKKILVSIIILIMSLSIVFLVYLWNKTPSIGEYYIIEFDESNRIEEEDYKILCNILNCKYEMEDIEIHKIACEVPFRHEGSYYIFFKTNNFKDKKLFDSCNMTYTIYNKAGIITERLLHNICFNTEFDEEYKKVRDICMKYYKFWENNDKHLNLPKAEDNNIVLES